MSDIFGYGNNSLTFAWVSIIKVRSFRRTKEKTVVR